MKKTNSKRLLTLVLALVLVFALSVGAYAAWPSFQKDATNNGTVPTGVTPPTGSSPTITSLQLCSNSNVGSGIDAASVINGNYAYTVYNGGFVNGTAGGARLSSVDLTTGQCAGNIQLDDDASNEFQLSTPYYDTTNNFIYAGVSYYDDELSGGSMSNWNSGAISGGVLTIPANSTVTLTMTGFLQHGSYANAYFTTNLWSYDYGDFSGTVSMENWTTHETYTFGTNNSYPDGYFSLYNNSGSLIPSGTYDVTLTLTNNTDAPVTATQISYMLYRWRLYKVAVSNGTLSTHEVIASGDGQIATPITGSGSYLYFGIYQGDRCYYQLDTSLPDYDDDYLLHFSTYSGEGYYWAGAAVVGNDVYFGDELGRIFKRPIGTGFDTGTGAVAYLTNDPTGAGAVRSSVCYYDGDLYVTTKNGFLWKVSAALNTVYSPIDLKNYDDPIYVQHSTSTPVVSDNGYIYVGGYRTYYDNNFVRHDYGAIKALPVNNWSSSALKTIWTSESEAVQSSVVTYSTTYYDEEARDYLAIDYLYFTTNGDYGKGRCVTYMPYYAEGDVIWDISAAYTLQGFAVSDETGSSGKLVFGNDSNYLYIVG